MSSPYVTTLTRLPPIAGETGVRLGANRLNLLGSEEQTVFNTKDVKSVRVSQHPFASFAANDKYYFVFTKAIDTAHADIKDALEVTDRARQRPN